MPAAAAAAVAAAVVIQCVCDYAQNVCDCAPFVEIVPTICMCHILLNSVAVAVAVQLATEMALNSEVGRLFGRSSHFLETPIKQLLLQLQLQFRILGILDLGNLGS